MDDIVAIRINRAAPGKGGNRMQIGPSVPPINVKGHQFTILNTADRVLQARCCATFARTVMAGKSTLSIDLKVHG